MWLVHCGVPRQRPWIGASEGPVGAPVGRNRAKHSCTTLLYLKYWPGGAHAIRRGSAPLGGWREGDHQPRLGFFCRDRLAPYVHDRHRADQGVRDYCWRCAMTGADRVIRWSTAGAVVGVAAAAAVASYEHAYALVRLHGEAGWTARLVPLTVDGLICQFDRDARLGAPQDAGPCSGAVAARRWHRGYPGGEHCPRPRTWPCRSGCGRPLVESRSC